MTLIELQNLAKRTIYKDWQFNVVEHQGDILLIVTGHFRERRYWINKKHDGFINTTRSISVKDCLTRSDFLNKVHEVIMYMEYHEMAEALYFDKLRVRDPHLDSADPTSPLP